MDNLCTLISHMPFTWIGKLMDLSKVDWESYGVTTSWVISDLVTLNGIGMGWSIYQTILTLYCSHTFHIYCKGNRPFWIQNLFQGKGKEF